METKELKRIHTIRTAAARVINANEERLFAKKEQLNFARELAMTCLCPSGFDNMLLRSSETQKLFQKESLLKKEVNNFFKVAGHPEMARKWDTWFSAVAQYNKFIEDISLSEPSLSEFNVLKY